MKTIVTWMVRGWNRIQGVNYRSEAMLERWTYPSQEIAVAETKKNLAGWTGDVYAIISPESGPSFVLEKE
ncbi:MAG: hypothetical protein E6R03_09010 [Hyphomicrobiaceae bacterium]|nr:MAG: hypothetical protein E6R03_09010 [Hyphomicrobiaceae bacterium]